MSIIALLLFIGGLSAIGVIFYYSFKLYKQGLIEDEINAQKELEQQATSAKTYSKTRKTNVINDMEDLKDFLNARLPKK